ncbi:hypothetical protein BG015_007337 [Linnemannia schmuckeri]|uniref:Peptidase M48 domain-containing protein n=1 Tax=Linnemannia schmuckeri TaxID=64567 RepID=A0A9P5RYL0_9FUNG|nr:hypothetical protein BG015_007337 [Linnemannia schmuckeri]
MLLKSIGQFAELTIRVASRPSLLKPSSTLADVAISSIGKRGSLTSSSGLRPLHYRRQNYPLSTNLRPSPIKVTTAYFHSSRQTQAASSVIPETLLALKMLQGEVLLVPAFIASHTLAYFTFGRKWFSNTASPSSKVVRVGRWVLRWSSIGLVVIMCLVGLEPAPNTGRMRLFFWTNDMAPVGAVGATGAVDVGAASTSAAVAILLSPSLSPPSEQPPGSEPVFLTAVEDREQPHVEEKGHVHIAGQLLQELKDNNLIVEDPDNKALQLVNHIFKNLLEGAVEDDGNHLKPYLKDSISPDSLKSTITFWNMDKTRAKVHVSKDKGQQTFADGFRNIVIEQDLVLAVGYDEDMVAAVLAHELAHAMQDHVHEHVSYQTTIFNAGCKSLTLVLAGLGG